MLYRVNLNKFNRRDVKHTARRPDGYFVNTYKKFINYNIEKIEKLESDVKSLISNSNSDTANILKYESLKEGIDRVERTVVNMESNLYKKSLRIEKILNQMVKSIIWWCPIKNMRDKLRKTFLVE